MALDNRFLIGVVGSNPQSFICMRSYNLRDPFSEDDAENLIKNVLALLPNCRKREISEWLESHLFDGRL